VIIVETPQEQKEFLDKFNTHPSIVVPIHNDLDAHPFITDISFLYVRIESDSYIISFNHVDCKQIEIDLSQSTTNKWVWNKKSLLQTNLGIQNLFDIQSYYFYENNRLYNLEPKEEQFLSHYTRKGLYENLGKTTPIMKWVEYLDLQFLDIPFSFNTSFVNNKLIPILSEVEKIPLRVETQKFIDRWPQSQKYLYNEEYVYTYYNTYTMTSRPSNRYGGINFNALNKKDGSRNCFIPRDGKIYLQFDYDAYHVRIIGKLIGYDLPTTSVHQWLADQYGMDYDESKGRTFRILYGGVSEEDKEIDFFNKVDEFIQKLWVDIEQKGYLKTGQGRIIKLEWIENPNPQKVFNYLLQATETEFNIEVLNELKLNNLPLPLLITYDSFMFEYGTDMNTDEAKTIKRILEKFGFPVKASWGMDYGEV